MLKELGLAIFVVLAVVLVAAFVFRCFLIAVGRTARSVVQIDVAGRRVAIWKPFGPPPPNGHPVIVFSHGFLGCCTQSIFLMEGLARAGYLVLAPDHRDAACGPGHRPGWLLRPSMIRAQKPFHRASGWSQSTYRDRGADLEAIVDALVKDPAFHGVPVDSARLGLAGHSLGGYTALALAGAWPSWKDLRVRAVLAMSPYCAPFITRGNLRGLDVPVMYQGGTFDIGVTPYVRRSGGAYDLTSSPKYLIEFAGAGHLAWTNLTKSYKDIINLYAIAFFDRHLKGDRDPDALAKLLARPWPEDVKEIRYEAR